MKKLLLIIFFFFWISEIFAQNFTWITPNKPYLKLYIIEDGIYRIERQDFLNAGISTNSIDPRTVKVWYKGNQLPIYFYGESDGVFHDSDYFDFYGQRNYGGLSNCYEEISGNMIVKYSVDEYYDLYSDTSVYWIEWGGAFGVRFNLSNFQSSQIYPDNYFYSKIHFEKDLLYSLGEHISPSDYRNFNTERIIGEGWFWRAMSRGNVISDTFRVPYLSNNPQLCYLKLFAYPNSYIDSIFNEHRLIIKVNNVFVDTLKRNDYIRFDTIIVFQSSLLNSSGVNQISFTYTNPSTYVGNIYFDMFELSYPRSFIFENNQISFNNNSTDTSSVLYKIKGFSQSNQINIYDVNNFYKIGNYFSNVDSLLFTGKKNGRFEIVNKNISKKPFNIKVKQVPDLVSGNNGADYIIIYNKLFESQAEQLKQHRTSKNNFRVVKAEVEDIYDIFNYGMENPIALRYFVKNAYDNWQFPRISYLCLFGRGSLDPKKNIDTNNYFQNFVPVYGYPNSDGYFANTRIGSFTYFQQIAVGRIPVYTIQEAQNVVNKIITFDNVPLDKWIKNFVFITGGFNQSEQNQFILQSNQLINSYITSSPTSGFPIKIYRNDSSGYATFNYRDSIKNAINKGTSIVNYIGHAATTFWDNGLEDPNELNNGEKQPLVLSMTCFTGKNCEPSGRSFGENFYLLPGKGAIGFIGTTGWSFSGSGNTFNGKMLYDFNFDTSRYIGKIIKYASNSNLQDTTSFASRNTINCYNLIGDPATQILIPRYPEFDIRMSDYWLSNPYPSLKENILLKIFPKNIGTYADSCKIRYQIVKNNIVNSQKDTVVKQFGFIDSLNYNFHIDSSGNYSIKIILDPDNWYPLELTSNNSITIPLSLKNISFVPLKPVNNQFINSDSVEFSGLNPLVTNFSSTKLLLSIDTSATFNSPVSQTYFKINPSGVYTRFRIKPIINDSNIVYYWRMNSIINGTDSSGWSETRRLTYYSMNKENITNFKNYYSTDSNVTLKFHSLKQFDQNSIGNFNSDSSGIKLGTFTGNLFAQSWGGNPFDATYFIINQSEYFFTDTSKWSGLNIARVRKLDGKLSELKHLWFTASSSSDSLVNYLENFDTNYILMIVKSIPISGTVNINANARNKLKQFGSVYADSITMTNLSRWSFISYRGLPTPIVSEGYLKASATWAPVQVEMNPVHKFTFGSLSININPAHFWKNIFIKSEVPLNTNLKYDVIGINSLNNEVLLRSDINFTNSLNLDTLNSYIYPGLKINFKFSIDTNFILKNSGFNEFPSPVLKFVNMQYIPPAELSPDNYSFVKSDSVLLEGDTLDVKLTNWNVGYVQAGSIISKWYATSPSGNRILKIDTAFVGLKVDSSFTPSIKFNTAGLRRPQFTKDTIYLFYESALLQKNDFYNFNNTAVTKFVLTGDSVKPIIDVTIDGTKVLSGDYIQANPQIILKFFDNSSIFIKDTTNIKIKLNNEYIPYFIGGIKNPIIDIIFFPQKQFLQAQVNFRPSLDVGEHKFEFVAFDANGIKADSVKYFLNVTNEFKLTELNNYPNPTKGSTSFIFNIIGSKPPTSSKIKIYTTAGRLIKTISFSAHIGLNQVYWDGTDEDGDSIANGVYFYKLIIDSESGIQSGIQKLVILK